MRIMGKNRKTILAWFCETIIPKLIQISDVKFIDILNIFDSLEIL